jgi:hypothetical protein
MRIVRSHLVPLTLCTFFLLAACGPADVSSTAEPSAAQSVTVAVSPSSIDVATENSVSFTAAVYGTADARVGWELQPGGGSIDSLGNYTAPATEGDYWLSATSLADSTARAVATIRVRHTSTAPVISAFVATPSSITAGQSDTLSWSVTGASSLSIAPGPGTVTGSSVVVSPTTTTTYTLTATNSKGVTTAATTVTVTGSGTSGTGTGTGGTGVATEVKVTGGGAMPSLVGAVNADACLVTAPGAATRSCLQAAADAAYAAGKPLVVNSGTYVTDQRVDVQTSVIGVGPTQPLIHQATRGSSSLYGILRVLANTSGWLYNLHLKGAYPGCNGGVEASMGACAATEFAAAIRLGGVNGVTIKNNLVESPEGDCFDDGQQENDPDGTFARNVLIDNNTCLDPYRTTVGLVNQSDRWAITNNVLSKTSGQGNWTLDIEPNSVRSHITNIEVAFNNMTNTMADGACSGYPCWAISTGTASTSSSAPGGGFWFHDNFGSWVAAAFWSNASSPPAWNPAIVSVNNVKR